MTKLFCTRCGSETDHEPRLEAPVDSTNWRSSYVTILEQLYTQYRNEEQGSTLLDLKFDVMTHKIGREECERKFLALQAELGRKRGAA